jgi:hypothetical protein
MKTFIKFALDLTIIIIIIIIAVVAVAVTSCIQGFYKLPVTRHFSIVHKINIKYVVTIYGSVCVQCTIRLFYALT